VAVKEKKDDSHPFSYRRKKENDALRVAVASAEGEREMFFIL